MYMYPETREYIEKARRMNDQDLILELNRLIKQDRLLTSRYHQLSHVIEKQVVPISFINPVYKRAQNLRKKVCGELNPIIDIRNNIDGLLHERGLVVEDDVISYEPNHQLDFTKVCLEEAV